MAGDDSADSKPQAWNAREIARRNRESLGRPLSPVMKTAATACELAHGPAAQQRPRDHRPDRSGEARPQRSTSTAKRSD